MIRDIRPLQSTDQNRLRDDDHRQGAKEDFARFLSKGGETEDTESFNQTKTRTSAANPSLIKGDALWSQFFVQLAGNNANDSNELFHWGELKENAKRHTEIARQSALLQDNTPLHILNEKI